MRCSIHGDHITITPALKEYVENKVGRLEKFDLLTDADDCRVTLRVTKKKHTVEVTIPAGNTMFRAEESSEDMYASVDLVTDKLNRMIRKYKDRMESQNRKAAAQPLPTAPVHEEEDADQLVRIKKFEYKPMDVEEAIMQMDLIGHTFFIFTNAENGQVNVVYKRNDGGYGLIEQGV
ncbi:ribosome hibernation-promoting factor, HPF/YfiA family [Brevibacillus migulae]|uniref:ribosome hibernation-promoting factor, HPF/YfiA family n=1 Tax=Brevibacillus migulae TaxID=1644114 RepID=UPI00106ED978|nr:ribosome-associated translation inhibitor RaiA [Brevibacillus migulae]